MFAVNRVFFKFVNRVCYEFGRSGCLAPRKRIWDYES